MSIPVNTPVFLGNEKKYLKECIDSGWISSEGPFVSSFEQKMADYVNRKYGIACSNGSAALDIAIRALNFQKGDEVILPSFTIISCAQSLLNSGVKPVPIDCDYRTFNMNINEIEKNITKNTKGIMIVHIYGITVDVDPILDLAEKYKLKIIEDAAEVLGQEYKGNKCGGIGDVSTFSFYPNKQITTGEGGMVLTNCNTINRKSRELRNLCFTHDRFVHYDLGWNYRMTNLQGAIGVAQLESIDKVVKKKRFIGEFYNNLLNDIECIDLPIKNTDYCENIYWVYPIVLNDKISKSAKEVMEILSENGIGTRPFFFPIHQQPVLKKMGLFKNLHLPNCEHLYQKGFYIPSGLALTKNDMETVSRVLHRILKD